MESGLAFLLQLLLVFAAIGQLLSVDCSLVDDLATSTETSILGGMTASLIHRDDYFESEWLTHRERTERDVRRSNLRAESLARWRKLAGTIAASGVPAPDSQEWESQLSDAVPSEYLMQISVGTPAETFVALADTGSDLTWLQCSPCMYCPSSGCKRCGNGVFDPTQSSTYTPLPCSSTACYFLNETLSYCPTTGNSVGGCPYGYGYGDGSLTTGKIAQDIITVASVSGPQASLNFTFGCSHYAASNTSLLDGADGLVGLGRGNISFPFQLGTYYGNVFGYCLVNRSISLDFVAYTPLYFGSDAVQAGQQLQYTPMILSGSTFYFVNCTGIALGGNNISAIPASAFEIISVNGTPEGGLFFDSGTTYTTLWENIFNPLSDALQKAITKYTTVQNEYFPLCYSAKWSEWVNDHGQGVPTISFQFSNTSGFPLSVDTAWITDDAGTTVCLAMQSINQNVNIFGNTQQVGYHIVYDSGKEQIGFGQADCKPTITNQRIQGANSHRPVASIGTSLVTGLVSLLLLLVLTQ